MTEIEDTHLDDYLELLERGFLLDDSRGKELYDKRVRVSIVPQPVESEIDHFGTIVGLIYGSCLGIPLVSEYISVKPLGKEIGFRHYTNYILWGKKKGKERIEQLKQDIPAGEERKFIVCTKPHGRIFKEMLYFLLAYERDGKMIWLNRSI